MGNNEFYFNAEAVAPSMGNEPFPKGDYIVAIVESEMKDTKAGTGKYIAFTMQLLEGSYKGRKLWINCNVKNPNPKAEQIGQGELSAICRACGRLNLTNLSQLHNIPFKVRVGTEVGFDGNERNVVKTILWKETTKPDLSAMMGVKKPDPDDFPPF